ncbi:hypothetical protein RKD49_005384 [Streptomyces glaucescens]
MSFPLDIRTELLIGGTWQDISPDVYVREVKNIARGLRDQGSTADPTTLDLTLNNRAGKYSPRNAMSPLFGMLGRNTPLRLSIPGSGESYLQLDGRAGGTVSTPDSAALDLTGDLDIRAEISPDWYGSENQLVIGKWQRDGLQQSWVLQIAEASVYFRYTISGDEYNGGRFFTRGLPTLPERAAIRVTLDLDNGNGGNTVTFYWAESIDGPWTQMGSPVVLPAGTTPIFSGTAPLSIGITDLRNGVHKPRYPMNGRGHRFEVRNGIDGPVVASPDFRALTPGATSFVDSAGLTWTLSGSAEVRDREDRFVGEVSAWPLRWSTDDADVWTPITATGILRRLGQGAKALDSPLQRRITLYGDAVAYWPMEDLSDAFQAYSPIPGVQAASLSSVEWASFDTLPASAPLPKLTGNSALSAPVPANTPGQWHVEMFYTADGLVPSENVELLRIHSSDGTVRRWEILLRSGLATVRGYSAANVKLLEHFIKLNHDVFSNWNRLRFFAVNRASGGLFDWRIEWEAPGMNAAGYGSTYAGTCGSVSLLSADWPALTEGWGIGHLAVLPLAGSDVYNGSDNAYKGETALFRMRRLCVEEKITLTRTAGRFPTERVGYQRLDTLLNLLDAAADADGGLLTEDMRRIGLHYRDRSSMYAQDPAITLSYTGAGLGPDLEPVDDDSEIVNDITVTRDAGSSARAVLETGPLSVLPPPDGIGRYDASYTVSLADDDQTEPHAYWRLHKGTYDGARYPVVSLLLHKPGAEWLIPLVHSLREGDKIRLTDLPGWVSHEDVDLLVMGWNERLDLYRWELDLNCVPAGPWNTALTSHNMIVENFESDTLNVDMTFAGAQPWGFSTVRYQYGTRSLKSGTITNNQDSDAILTLPADATSLSFWYRTSSEASGPGFTGDYLTVTVDGVEVLRAQGETPWTNRVLDVSGANTVRFRYHKDNSAGAGSDSAWIDYLVITTEGPTGQRASATNSSLGAEATATATTLTVLTPDGLLWTEEPADFPFNIRVGGEVMTVTGITPVNTTAQTFTVQRSINGVEKAHAVGTQVQVADSPITSL